MQATLADTMTRDLVDPFGRVITYLRVSVTDRCDFRCTYCMSEHMTFLPRRELLTLEELDRLCSAFVHRGVRKLRLTGGEPLVRRDFLDLVRGLSRHLASGALDELTLTTNASQLRHHARALAQAGVKRINVSLDTLDPELFRQITRRGKIEPVIEGIDAALAEGIAVKINTVALRGLNETELPDLAAWAHARGMDITFIETMPLGETGEDRTDRYLDLSVVRASLAQRFTLEQSLQTTGGPARYVSTRETGRRIGFITPLSHNFCEGCNRLRVTCTGTLFMCLGKADRADLRTPLRESSNDGPLHAAIDEAISRKPRGHDFSFGLDAMEGGIPRHMSVTGG